MLSNKKQSSQTAFLVQSPFEKISTFVGNKTQIAYVNSLKLIARLIDILGNEGKLKEFFEKIWDAIAQWFLKNKKAFALIEEKRWLDLLEKVQKGAGNITKTFAENAGIKIEHFLSKAKVLGQSTDHTCAATSLRMVLEDKGIVKSEEYLAKALKTDANGASILDIPEALYHSYLDEVKTIVEERIKFSKLLEKLQEGDKAIVSIGTREFGSHAVVLEKVENGKVFLRDPLPIHQGASYSMKIENFEKIFKDKAVIIKK